MSRTAKAHAAHQVLQLLRGKPDVFCSNFKITSRNKKS